MIEQYLPDQQPADNIEIISDITNPMDNLDDVAETSNTTDSWSLFALKCMVVPTAAIFSSLSLPLSIIAIEKKISPNLNPSLEQKILQTLLPYSALVGFRTWLLWYRIGERLDGKPDKPIEASSDTQEDVSMAVSAGMIANISAFTNGFLVMFRLLQKENAIMACAAGTALGLLSYTTDLLTDVTDALRKYIETQQLQGKHIHPFFKQKIIERIFNSHIEKFGVFLREALPIITGIIRSQTTVQVASSLLKNQLSETQLQLLNFILGLTIYEASAYFSKFDLIQLHDSLDACRLTNFNLENTLVASPNKPIRLLGKLANGQLLIDIFQKMKLSATNSVNASYAFAAVGFMSLIFTVFQSYVSSTHSKAVQDDEEGLLMSYYFGEETALEIAPKALVGTVCTAVTLGAIGIFAQTGTLKQYAKNRPNQTRTAQVEPVEAIPNGVERQVMEF